MGIGMDGRDCRSCIAPRQGLIQTGIRTRTDDAPGQMRVERQRLRNASHRLAVARAVAMLLVCQDGALAGSSTGGPGVAGWELSPRLYVTLVHNYRGSFPYGVACARAGTCG